MSAGALILGIHMLSAHARPGFETVTAGVYLQSSSGLTAGVLRNSEGRLSLYAGQTWHTSDGRFALTVGGITGYRSARVVPLVIPSMRVQLAPNTALRLSGLPQVQRGGSAALHLSIELSN